MFRAFYWFFQRKELWNTVLKRTAIILLAALIITAIFCLSCYSIFSNTYILYGYSGLILACIFALVITFFIMGYYGLLWELVS